MILIQLLLLTLIVLEYSKSMEIVKEGTNDISDYIDGDNSSDNDDNFISKPSINCNLYDDERTCKNYYTKKIDLLRNLFKRVPNHGARLIPFQNVEHEEQFLPLYHTTSSLTFCGCNLTVKMRDLGLGYYPRFLKDGKCNPRSCRDGFNCREKHYKVRVLKHRSTPFPSAADIQSSDSAVPEGLRDVWKAASVPITVACECL